VAKRIHASGTPKIPKGFSKAACVGRSREQREAKKRKQLSRQSSNLTAPAKTASPLLRRRCFYMWQKEFMRAARRKSQKDFQKLLASEVAGDRGKRKNASS